MAIHVIIKRKWHVCTPEDLFPLLNSLKDRAIQQPGHLSSQMLRSSNDLNEYIVISRWESQETWDKWLVSKDRREIQGKIDSMIGEKTFFEIYENVDDDGNVISGQR